MAERQAMNDLKPRGWQGGIVTIRQPVQRQLQCCRVLREGARTAAPHRARKLIEQDDERQPALRIDGPMIETARSSLCGNIGKAGNNVAVRAASHPPAPVFLMGVWGDCRRVSPGEPELKHLGPGLLVGWGLHVHISVKLVLPLFVPYRTFH